jgi:predicted nucleic acid-binding protein
MILCDTNIFIHAFNGREDTIARLNSIGKSDTVLAAITVMELYQGMGDKNELAQMKKRIKHYDVIHIDEHISAKAVQLIADYKLSHGLCIPDALIAATSLIYDIPLFTYNTKDFKFIKNINLY